MKKIKNFLKTRFNALHNDESGAETIEVILVLIAVIALIGVIKFIVAAVTKQGNNTANCISGSAAGC